MRTGRGEEGVAFVQGSAHIHTDRLIFPARLAGAAATAVGALLSHKIPASCSWAWQGTRREGSGGSAAPRPVQPSVRTSIRLEGWVTVISYCLLIPSRQFSGPSDTCRHRDKTANWMKIKSYLLVISKNAFVALTNVFTFGNWWVNTRPHDGMSSWIRPPPRPRTTAFSLTEPLDWKIK